jgi:hypothetical protein
VFFELRVIGPNLRRIAIALATEMQQRQRRAIEVFRVDAKDVVLQHIGIELADKIRGFVRFFAAHLRLNQGRDLFDHLLLQRFHPD